MSLCITCGHALRHHASLADIDDCAIPGCTCTKYEAMPATIPASEIWVRCAGHPGTTPPCTWTSTPGDPADDGHCPNCDGLVEEVEPVPATTPTAVAGPPPDLQQVILPAAVIRLRNLAMAIPISDSDTDTWDRAALMAGAYAIERAEDALEQLQAAQAENQQLRDHILDIDAHATPYGDLPDDPSYVGTYLVTAGALHRAVGKLGHTAPSCTAEAAVQRLETFEQAAQKAWNNQDLDALGQALAQLHVDKVIADALEHHAALGQVVGYQTPDGKCYAPEDITIAYAADPAALGQVDQP